MLLGTSYIPCRREWIDKVEKTLSGKTYMCLILRKSLGQMHTSTNETEGK